MPSETAPSSRQAVPTGFSLALIVARATNDVIGQDNQLVWSIPEEMAHFKATTMGHSLLMGRKTWESIGRPLPGRRSIVISRRTGYEAKGCEVAGSVSEAIELACTATAAHPTPSPQIFVIGGAQIYKETLAFASRIVLTQVDLSPSGDALFDWRPDTFWACETRRPLVSRTGTAYEIQDWQHQPGN